MTSFKNAESNIYISPIPYIEKLKRILNVTDESVDFNDESIFQKLKEKRTFIILISSE